MSQWKNTHNFWCMTCDKEKGLGPFDVNAIKDHLKATHGLERRITGKRALNECLDGSGFYQENWTWTLPGQVKLAEVVVGKRQ